FVAGADIAEIAKQGDESAKDLSRHGHEVFNMIENCPKPVIAAVNGFALGGGCELAMACHIRVASENARFGQPEVNLGLIPGYGGTQRLTRIIGKGRAIELLITGDIVSAQDAYRVGLANFLTTPEELMPKCIELLEKVKTKGPIAIGYVIKAANDAFDKTIDGYETEIELFGKCFATEDFKEGTSAFLEKRKAVFTGK
ncbi:MAG: enoyl-CoA hydratase, partial [Moraxellaceae bacterium]